MNPIVRGTKPSPGVVTITPRSDVIQFMLNVLPTYDEVARMVLRSSSISEEERPAMLVAHGSPYLEVRKGMLYDVTTAGNLVWVPSCGMWFGETEVTTSQYGSHGREFEGKGDLYRPTKIHRGDQPMRLDWVKALIFCNVMSELDHFQPYYNIKTKTVRDGWGDEPEETDIEYTISVNPGADGYRLPTVNEFACAQKGSVGFYLSDLGWFKDNQSHPPVLHPVAEKAPDKFGLYDLWGNVNEWCWDESSESHRFTLQRMYNYIRPLRGGSYKSMMQDVLLHGEDRTMDTRWGQNPNIIEVGFRLCRSGR